MSHSAQPLQQYIPEVQIHQDIKVRNLEIMRPQIHRNEDNYIKPVREDLLENALKAFE
jgi:hypothetical protein